MHIVHPLINEARRAFPVARKKFLRTRCLSAGENPGPAVRARATGDNQCSHPMGSSSAIAAAERLLSVTRALLLVNADHLSAWNARKQVVLDGLHGSVEDEIKVRDKLGPSCMSPACSFNPRHENMARNPKWTIVRSSKCDRRWSITTSYSALRARGRCL